MDNETEIIKNRCYLYRDSFQNYKVYQIPHAQLIIADVPYCYDADTECWTKDGWKSITDIDLTDEVLSLNQITLEMEYSGIQNIIIKDAPENMLHFENNSIDLCVTDNHRMFCMSKTRRTNTLGLRNRGSKYDSNKNIRLASEITQGCYIPLFGYKWKGLAKSNGITIRGCWDNTNGQEHYNNDVFIDWETWLPFFGLWLADGYTTRKCSHSYTIGIKQGGKNKDKVKEILSLLPFKWHEYPEKNTDKSNFEIHSKQLYQYMSIFGGSHDKFIPREILDLPKEYLDIFFEWYTFGDSHKNGSGLVISSVSKKLIYCLQELQLKRGEICQVRVDDKNYASTLYFFQTDKTKSSVRFWKPTLEKPKHDFVWCLTLKTNSVFLVRRNGLIAFCGNCIGEDAYASNPAWYKGGDIKNGESELAGKQFFSNDKDFRPAEFMHFCSQMLVKEHKGNDENTEMVGSKVKSHAPCMILFCAFEQLHYFIELGNRYGFKHYIPLVFRKNFSAQVLKANMKVVGNCEYGLILYKNKLPKFNNEGKMVFNCIDWEQDTNIPKCHPCQKPVALIKKLVRLFSDEDDVVIDPCCGSGSTLRAAIELNRKAYGFEINKQFYNDAKNKMLKYYQTELFA